MPNVQENIATVLLLANQLPSSILVLLGVALIYITLMFIDMSKH